MATTAQIQAAIQRAQAAGDTQAVAALQAGLATAQDAQNGGYAQQLQANFSHNDAYAKPGPYFTTLAPAQEQQFRQWVKANHVNFDPNAKITDYDMRGFWLAQQQGGSPKTQVNQYDHKLHFTDEFKTPYDRTFSNQSRYAQPNAPHWVDDRYLVTATGNQIFDQANQTEDAPWPSQQAQGPTREQVSNAFYRAQAAGDEDAARHLIGYIQQHGMTLAPMSPEQENAAFQHENAKNVAAQSPALTALQGVGKSFVDTGRGIGELVGAESPQDVANARQADQALMDTTAGKLGNYGGQFAQAVALGGVAGYGLKGAALLGRAAPYVSSALAGGAFSGAQPVTGDESRGLNTLAGTALGAAGEAVPRGLGALAGKAAPSITAAKQAAIDTAEKYGIPLHLSQVTDSRPLQTLASVTKYLPFSGNRAAADAQRTAFNRALSSTVGQNATELTPDVMNAARSANSAGYNALFDRNTVQLGAGTWQKLGQIAAQAKQDLPPDQAQVVINQIGKYVEAAKANNGVIPGRLYQSVRQTVQKVEGQNQPSKYLVGQVRKTMQDAANQSIGPQDAAALKALNGQYGNLKILDRALGQAQGANYSVTPANLWRLVNTKYGSTPEMRDLAQLGQTVLKDPIPDSGTAQRMLYEGGLLGGAAMAPHTVLPGVLAGATVGRVLNSPLAARTLPYAGQNLLLGLSRASQPANRLLPLLAPDVAGAVPIVTGQQ